MARTVYVKRDVYVWKETYICEKDYADIHRVTHGTCEKRCRYLRRDLDMCKQRYIYGKRSIYVKRGYADFDRVTHGACGTCTSGLRSGYVQIEVCI